MSDEVKGLTDEEFEKMYAHLLENVEGGMRNTKPNTPVREYLLVQQAFFLRVAAKDKEIEWLREGLRLADTLAGLCNWHDAKDMPGLTAARDAYRASRKGQK